MLANSILKKDELLARSASKNSLSRATAGTYMDRILTAFRGFLDFETPRP
jgi:hypothetical protein